jgi:hypothetical protein
MVKNKSSMWKVLRFITLVLVLLASACSDRSNENTEPKVLKITGMGEAGTCGLIYLYTNGASGVGDGYRNVTRINFSNTVTTVSLDKFASFENENAKEPGELAAGNTVPFTRVTDLGPMAGGGLLLGRPSCYI